MENPFEVILERLDRIESLLEKLQSDKIAGENKEEKFLSPQEAADFLGDAQATLYGKQARTRSPFINVERNSTSKKSELIEWIEAGKCRTIDDLIGNAPKDSDISTPAVAFFILWKGLVLIINLVKHEPMQKLLFFYMVDVLFLILFIRQWN